MPIASSSSSAYPSPWLRLILFTVLVRGGVLAARFDGLADDPDAYRRIAVHLIQDGVLGHSAVVDEDGTQTVQPTAFRPPLYPVLLAAFGWSSRVSSLSVAVLHLILGVGSVLFSYRIAGDWGLGRWRLLPAVLVACDPILLNQSTLVMTETIATFMALLGLWLLTRLGTGRVVSGVLRDTAEDFEGGVRAPASLSFALAGAGIAMASLCRPTFLIWSAACLLVVAAACRVRRWRWTALFFLGACLALSPWILRNYWTLGRPIVATTHGGYTLLLGNNEGFYEHLRRSPFGSVWDSAELDAQVLRVKEARNYDELAADRWAGEQAKLTIRGQPGMFVYSCAVRVGRLWRPAPHALSPEESAKARAIRYAIGLWYIIALGTAIVGVWRLGPRLLQRPWIWGLLLCLAFTIVHAFYWSNLRMRAPLMPVVYLAVAAAWQRTRADGPIGA